MRGAGAEAGGARAGAGEVGAGEAGAGVGTVVRYRAVGLQFVFYHIY